MEKRNSKGKRILAQKCGLFRGKTLTLCGFLRSEGEKTGKEELTKGLIQGRGPSFKGSCLNPCVVIASDPALAGERGNLSFSGSF